ncbi:hypothetical protein UO65_3961 [Actinokineospora spheciospongiae]|uniref:Uncharacterized protein n=1 Tax=Actinokineospora spheciospongiae TaxID=909613 RepID=W7IJZ0_9PSEU|nr:hypothetical protein [Actinokineospora spheciospongiae]EWC60678.1 hypothetical protein UO65_3961 [Actinokineospora spheciospongiae]PWW64438.1 hypothetical protein DFQ13_103412 [Actinokineospora spheciospongiae]
MDTLEIPGHRGSVTADRPACDCGWLGEQGPEAPERWWRHAIGAADSEPPSWLLVKSDVLRDQVVDMISTRPEVALKLLAEVDRWTRPLTERAVAAARGRGATWAEVGTALGVSRQAAHERFREVE